MAEVRWVNRSGVNGWNARSSRGDYQTMPARPRGVKVHYTGGQEDPRMLLDHSRCVSRVQSIQSGHISGNGWIDVGYSYLVCPHRRVFVGRGFGHLPAANGPGLNSAHYAVLGMVGSSGLTTPPDEMLHGIRDVIEYLRSRGVGNEIKGHRDGYPTDCPGPRLYAWVQAGAPRPPGGQAPVPTPPTPAVPPQKGDRMDYTSLGYSGAGAKDIPANAPFDVLWDTEYADPTKSHVDEGANASFLDGPRSYVLDAEVTLTGLLDGDTVETRLVEVRKGTSPGEVLEDTQWRPTFSRARDGVVLVTHAGIGAVQAGRKLRLQVMHNSTSTVKISRAWLRMKSEA